MKEKENSLNLPAIRKPGASPSVTGIQRKKAVSKLDLCKKTNIASILNSGSSLAEKAVLESQKGLDLVLIGDLTTSMTSYHQLLKDKFKELCQTLFSMIKNLKIGIIFYLDHDAELPYCTRVFKLSSNIEQLVSFIENTPVLHSGNSTDDEAAEDALYDAVNIGWREICARSVVLFGDARPHEPSGCPNNYSYFEIVKRLYGLNVIVNSVYCRGGYELNDELQKLMNVNIGDFSRVISNPSDPEFFSWIANVTGGMAINIEKVDDLADIITTAAANDSGHLDDLENRFKASAQSKLCDLKKLRLIEFAKKAKGRKRLGANGTGFLESV